MSKVLLIAYTTKTGTTEEISYEIASVFSEKGIEADVLSVSEIKNLDEYFAVIVGSPVNGMRILPEAIKFVKDNQESLKKIPTAYFNVSYMIDLGREFFRKKISSSINSLSKIVEPVKTGLFGGKVDTELPAFARVIFGVKKSAPIDVRDFEKVRKWAEELYVIIKNKSEGI